MVVQEEISIWFPKVGNGFNLEDNSFTINQIKSRVPSVVYFNVHCWDLEGVEINSNGESVGIDEVYYTSERWIIDKTYSSYTDLFNFTETILSHLKEVQIELRIIGVDDNNPLYFTECMLMNKPFDGVRFYETDEKNIETEINFNNTRHANLYTNDDYYLQVIRPYGDKFTTNKFIKSNCTVLAPHIDGETTHDKPKNLYLEFINQTEQTTNIKTT